MKKLFLILPLLAGCVSTKKYKLDVTEAYVKGLNEANKACSAQVADLQSKVDDYKRVYRIWKDGLKKAEKAATGK